MISKNFGARMRNVNQLDRYIPSKNFATENIQANLFHTVRTKIGVKTTLMMNFIASDTTQTVEIIINLDPRSDYHLVD